MQFGNVQTQISGTVVISGPVSITGTVTVAGTVSISSGTVSVTGTVNVAGSVSISSGTVNATITAGTVDLSSTTQNGIAVQINGQGVPIVDNTTLINSTTLKLGTTSVPTLDISKYQSLFISITPTVAVNTTSITLWLNFADASGNTIFTQSVYVPNIAALPFIIVRAPAYGNKLAIGTGAGTYSATGQIQVVTWGSYRPDYTYRITSNFPGAVSQGSMVTTTYDETVGLVRWNPGSVAAGATATATIPYTVPSTANLSYSVGAGGPFQISIVEIATTNLNAIFTQSPAGTTATKTSFTGIALPALPLQLQVTNTGAGAATVNWISLVMQPNAASQY